MSEIGVCQSADHQENDNVYISRLTALPVNEYLNAIIIIH
jgi:hypothetical protein